MFETLYYYNVCVKRVLFLEASVVQICLAQQCRFVFVRLACCLPMDGAENKKKSGTEAGGGGGIGCHSKSELSSSSLIAGSSALRVFAAACFVD